MEFAARFQHSAVPISSFNNKWLCAQIGAREHYAVPRVLHREGRFAGLYTDYWAGSLVRPLAAWTQSGPFRSQAARFHPELANVSVRSWNNWALLRQMGRGRQTRNVYDEFIEIGAAFAVRVRESLKQHVDARAGTIFFSYDTGALEALQWCREHGVKSIVDQMDPNRVEVDLVCEEESRWPGWATQPMVVPEAYFRRREQEWVLADIVMVNSEFCRDALLKQGVPARKLAVVPLCFETIEAATVAPPDRNSSSRGLRVLFLGQVILRKGIQYLIQAARLLEGENVHFDVVGPMGVSDIAVKTAPKNVTFHGRATRDQTANWYKQSDVFVLPTLSDGFALTQLEAMSYGLPVVATPNCGAVVTDGVDGFIVPPRDPQALAIALQRYLGDRDLLARQRSAALKKVQQFSLNHLAANLVALEDRLSAGQ